MAWRDSEPLENGTLEILDERETILDNVKSYDYSDTEYNCR